jgi:hypothetical protein
MLLGRGGLKRPIVGAKRYEVVLKQLPSKISTVCRKRPIPVQNRRKLFGTSRDDCAEVCITHGYTLDMVRSQNS